MSHLNLQDTTVENEVITIQDTDSFNAIGKGATLKNCEVQLAVPSRALSIAGTIIGGTIHTKRELHGFDWLDARLDGVKFKGRFKNNRFGCFPPMYNNGSLANCDFSEAKLCDALFLNTNCDGVKFGAWPYFTVTNSPAFHAGVEECAESSAIWDYLSVLSDYITEYGDDVVTLRYMTIDAEDLCKRESIDIEALRSCLNSIDGIVQ